MRRWFMWIPVLMVASLLFWTTALALGGTSLMKLSAAGWSPGCTYDHAETAGDPDSTGSRTGYDPIVVQIRESPVADDADENPSLIVTPAVEDMPVIWPAEPGRTAF